MSRKSNQNTPPRTPSAGNGITRRTVLSTVAAGLGTAIMQGKTHAQSAAEQLATPAVDTGRERRLVSDLGQRSPYEKPRRLVGNVLPSSASKTPLQDLNGIVTPSDLHYERHHTGVPIIDPDKYTLKIGGLVERPMTLTLQDLKQFPERSAHRFVECGNNGIPGYAGMRPELTPQQIDGMASTSEWTGISFATLLDAVRPLAEATWFYIEGHDGGWPYSVPMAERWNESLIAWGQNGEALRPEQGYPVRLILAGHPGGPNIKWLSSIEFKSDPMPGQAISQFNAILGAKSIITYPAYPNVLAGPGPVKVSGLAWTGHGKIARVDISSDGGQTWAPAELQQPVLPYCQTRFRYRWNWDGSDALLVSRATDEAGNVQISLAEARAARETNKQIRHYYTNMRTWAVAADGVVTFHVS